MVNERFMVNVIKDTVMEPVAKTKIQKSKVRKSDRYWLPAMYDGHEFAIAVDGKMYDIEEEIEESYPVSWNAIMNVGWNFESRTQPQGMKAFTPDQDEALFNYLTEEVGVVLKSKARKSKAKKSAIKKFSVIDTWADKVDKIKGLYSKFEARDDLPHSERESEVYHMIDDGLDDYIEILEELVESPVEFSNRDNVDESIFNKIVNYIGFESHLRMDNGVPTLVFRDMGEYFGSMVRYEDGKYKLYMDYNYYDSYDSQEDLINHAPIS